MIRYIKQADLDYEKWDNCISSSINNVIYAYSWYLDIVAGKWDALVEDDYSSVMPLPFKSKCGFTKFYQPFFAQQLGVFSKEIISKSLVNKYLKHLEQGFKIVDICMNNMNPVSSTKLKTESRKTFMLDLIEPYESIKANYSQNHNRNIKKAEKSKLFYTEDSGFEEIVTSFKNNRGNLFPEISEQHYKIFKSLIYACIYKGVARIIKAYDENNSFNAGAIFLLHNNKAVFIFSGAEKTSRDNGAMFGIIDHFIRKYNGTNLTLDFEGSMDKNLARFYSGFGAKECVFLRIKKSLFKF